MLLVDTRRLTGPNLLARAPLVIVEIDLEEGDTVSAALAAYVRELGRMRAAVGLAAEVSPVVRTHTGGAVFGYEAPLDEMLACAEMSEWAGMSASRALSGEAPLPLEPKRAEVAALLSKDASPNLRAIAAVARQRGLPFLWDDALVTVGAGARALTFGRYEAPEPDAVPWETLARLPVVLITGTNGKTTCARLMARVAREAGRRVGFSSTGGVVVGAKTIEEGDWTGPAAARVVLRRPDVDFAVLETARGGILRRGLAVDFADAALITNVSDDHLGLYGIDDLEAMTQVKSIIADVVPASGVVVLNARDPKLVGLSARLAARVVFFCDLETADAAARAFIASRRARGETVILADGGDIVIAEGAAARSLGRVDAAPITFGGVARYNVENILGVVGLAHGLELPEEALARAVASFGARDNPGRGELVDYDGVKVFLDFGHNPEAVRAALHLVTDLRRRTGGCLTVITGSAGDRSNREIEDVAGAIVDAKPDTVLVRDLPGYLRGRAPGEVPALFRSIFLARGFPEGALHVVGSEVEALELAFAAAVARGRAGDVVALLVHLDHEEVQALLRRPRGVA